MYFAFDPVHKICVVLVVVVVTTFKKLDMMNNLLLEFHFKCNMY
jgi:hypothetical protein